MRHRLLATRERRWIENDQVVPLAVTLQQAQLFKGIGLAIATTSRHLVLLRMRLCQRYGRRAHIQPLHRLRSGQRSLNAEPAGVAKGFQHDFPFCEEGRGDPVFPLIAEPAGLLPLRNIDRKLGLPLVNVYRRGTLTAQKSF